VSEYEIKDFIGIFPKAIPDDLCDHLIQQFNKSAEVGMVCTRKPEMGNMSGYKVYKDDLVTFSYDMPLDHATSMSNVSVFQRYLQDCYLAYAEEYSASVGDAANHASYMFKVQKTEIGQGYHVWHFEASNRESAGRLLAWTVYLNDVEEGGETEFLYQHKRVKPEKGTVCIFPASFTHTHRGNPPLSNTKYIVTGWYEY
jgi:hypothetical protein